MVSQKVKVNNLIGLHLRPAGRLCSEAMQFKSLITFSYSKCEKCPQRSWRLRERRR